MLRANETTVDLQGVGPEAEQSYISHRVGLVKPRRLEFGSIPISYTVTASGFSWTHWGTSKAIGRGSGEVCVNMTPCYSGRLEVVLSGRSLIECAPSVGTHYSYRRLAIHFLDQPSPPYTSAFRDPITPGCAPNN